MSFTQLFWERGEQLPGKCISPILETALSSVMALVRSFLRLQTLGWDGDICRGWAGAEDLWVFYWFSKKFFPGLCITLCLYHKVLKYIFLVYLSFITILLLKNISFAFVLTPIVFNVMVKFPFVLSFQFPYGLPELIISAQFLFPYITFLWYSITSFYLGFFLLRGIQK